MQSGVVFIAEDEEVDDRGRVWFTGQFDAHWESDDGQDFREGPEGVTAEEAVRWGRQQADVVQIRVGNGDLGGADHGYFSAGTRQPDGDELPIWSETMSISRRPIKRAD